MNIISKLLIGGATVATLALPASAAFASVSTPTPPSVSQTYHSGGQQGQGDNKQGGNGGPTGGQSGGDNKNGGNSNPSGEPSGPPKIVLSGNNNPNGKGDKGGPPSQGGSSTDKNDKYKGGPINILGDPNKGKGNKTPCKTKGYAPPVLQSYPGYTDPKGSWNTTPPCKHHTTPVTTGWTPQPKCHCKTEVVTFSFATDPGKPGTWLLEDSGPALYKGESLTYEDSTWTVGTWTAHGDGTLGNDKEYFTLTQDTTTLSGIIGAPVQTAKTICKNDPSTTTWTNHGQKCNHKGITHPVETTGFHTYSR